ncbi:MAG: KTSC domain-containing protein [Thermodesulfobacteriota bacterium]
MIAGPLARFTVVSSVINSIGYCLESRALEIEFQSGAVYRFVDVPKETFEDFLKAESKGSFFNKHVRSLFAFGRAA